MDNELRFAVLIDADNISDKYIKIILEETANNGIATYKRIYGDWTSQRMNSWKNVLLDNSVIPMQQYSYTTGKNATDSAMIIDAMDILYSGNVDGFCLVSSDSDFTRLAARIREEGMQVIGMGESKTPQPFISACNQFKYLDLLYEQKAQEEAEESSSDGEVSDSQDTALRTDAQENAARQDTAAGQNSRSKESSMQSVSSQGKGTKKNSGKNSNPRQKDLRRIRRTINAIIEKFSDDDDWIFTGKLGDQLARRLPDFDVRNFGYSKLTPFIRSLGQYEVQERWDDNHQKQVYVRRKR